MSKRCGDSTGYTRSDSVSVLYSAGDDVVKTCCCCGNNAAEVGLNNGLDFLTAALAEACAVKDVYVILTNVAFAVYILICVKTVAILLIGMRAGCRVPVIFAFFVNGPLVSKGVGVAALVSANVANTVLVSIDVSRKVTLVFAMLAGRGMPVLRRVALPFAAIRMLVAAAYRAAIITSGKRNNSCKNNAKKRYNFVFHKAS